MPATSDAGPTARPAGSSHRVLPTEGERRQVGKRRQEGGLPKEDRKRVARFLPFPLRATLEETLKRREELPGGVGTNETTRQPAVKMLSAPMSSIKESGRTGVSKDVFPPHCSQRLDDKSNL